MTTDISRINLNTDEGKLLRAAIIEITTRLHTGLTPDEVIKRLWEIHYNTEKANAKHDFESGAALTNGRRQGEFSLAVDEAIVMSNEKKKAVLDAIMSSGEVLLEHSIVLGKEKRSEFKELLVLIYRIKAGK